MQSTDQDVQVDFEHALTMCQLVGKRHVKTSLMGDGHLAEAKVTDTANVHTESVDGGAGSEH